ncbi:MAG TPA: hypothetical protein VIG29_00225, partial [Vicinamibacteria bacterium]
GGARSVAGDGELAAVLRTWSSEAAIRESIGRKAQGYVERQRGAARRTAEALAHFLSGRTD